MSCRCPNFSTMLPQPQPTFTSYIGIKEGRVVIHKFSAIVTVQLGRDVATDRAGTVSRHEARPGRSQDTCHQQRLSGLGV